MKKDSAIHCYADVMREQRAWSLKHDSLMV